MWAPDMPGGYESRKCRYRVASYCKGRGLDLSAKSEKIVREAIGIGKEGSAGDIYIDLSANDALNVFSDNSFDYVYDAHQLGNYVATEAVLKEWWRLVKPGGVLILYEQDRDFYPHAGTSGADSSHRKDLVWQDAWDILKGFKNAEKISSSRHGDSNEYSWQLVVRKEFARTKKPPEKITDYKVEGCMAFPRKKVTDKEALVIRYGALGDSLWVTPVLKQLKKEGYYVVYNCPEYSAQVLRECPYIDEFIIHHTTLDIPHNELTNYWEVISESFDKVVNLTQSIEGALVKCEGSDEYEWSHEKRHKECNINYQDRTMECAGYSDMKGQLPEMHFTDIEEHLAKNFTNHHRDKFTIIWGMSGSAYHKTYPWSEYVAQEFCTSHQKDVEIITVGDEGCRILEWQNPLTINKCGMWTVRQAFIMTKYADLVIGPDTGLLNAASCFETPKIVFMRAGSEENLTKYWKNVTPLSADDCECHPCHKLIYSNSCPKGHIQGIAPKCMEHIRPEKVIDVIEDYYQQWKVKRAKQRNEKRIAAFTIADDELTHRLARRVRTSFGKHHPEIPFYIYDCADEEKIFGEVKNSACACKAFEIRPRLCEILLEDYDCVIYLDADTVVTDSLDEFLETDYDVAGSLNLEGNGFPPGYLNAGVSAITSRDFCTEWTDLMYKHNGGPSNQVYFNELAKSGRYRLKVVDAADVYYNETSRPYWKDIRLKDGKFVCNNRRVKVLHWAGGVGRMEDKLSSSDFSEEVRNVLNVLTHTKDFTEIEGQEVSQWK
jgi:ADP-heptose:LPS heptosyltransferase/ubiquinone/menaquinone biosynthesis C-methylase UbiE